MPNAHCPNKIGEERASDAGIFMGHREARPEPDEWERRQKFIIPNPPSSPWPK
jgi:hypothetical protein